MSEKKGRTPRNYSGLEPPGKQIRDLLPSILEGFEKRVVHSPDELLLAWPKLVGEKIAPMAQAVSCSSGTLVVKVANATLYSLLMQHEKERLLKQIQIQFPHLQIKKILFRMG